MSSHGPIKARRLAGYAAVLRAEGYTVLTPEQAETVDGVLLDARHDRHIMPEEADEARDALAGVPAKDSDRSHFGPPGDDWGPAHLDKGFGGALTAADSCAGTTPSSRPGASESTESAHPVQDQFIGPPDGKNWGPLRLDTGKDSDT